MAKSGRNFRRWSIAAAILVIVLAYFQINPLNTNPEIVYQTTYGETEQFDLPDGSKVVLNANSELKFLNKNPREVWLKGEAYFDVKKLPAKNLFLVHTEDLVVEVHGTSFNVNSRHQKTKVVLEEGSIKLNLNGGTQEWMQPGDLISYSAKNAKVLEKKNAVNTQPHSSWKDGTIEFDFIEVLEATQKIADHYGVTFRFERPELQNKVINGGVPNYNLQSSLTILEKIINAKIENRTDHYFIRQKQQ